MSVIIGDLHHHHYRMEDHHRRHNAASLSILLLGGSSTMLETRREYHVAIIPIAAALLLQCFVRRLPPYRFSCQRVLLLSGVITNFVILALRCIDFSPSSSEPTGPARRRCISWSPGPFHLFGQAVRHIYSTTSSVTTSRLLLRSTVLTTQVQQQ